MVSPTERIAQIEKELQKYTVKKSQAKTLAAVGSSIGERMKILGDIHNEIVAISKELYFYDMVDYLGNLRIDSLSLSQCISLAKELQKANDKFRSDGDEKYLALGMKMYKKIFWAGSNAAKEQLKLHNTSKEFIEFYRISPLETKYKLRKQYFNRRQKDISKNIKICSNEIERNYQLLILGEITAYEKVFDEKIDQTMLHFEDYIFDIFRYIFNRKNKDAARNIVMKMSKEEEESVVGRLFKKVAKNYCFDKSKESVEI